MLNLPQYRVDEQIYESNNSLVYRGVRQTDGQPVILKLLQGEYPTSQQLTNYQQEYQITKAFEIEGVVKVYDLLKYRNSLVMVVEDFGGESLAKLDLAGRLRLPEFLSLAISLSQIVGQVHQQKIIHKDINPANIVMARQGDNSNLRLIDFGIATRLTRQQPSFQNPTMLQGTLAYISPEQTGRMNRAIDYRTDLYSLGVTFYELLTGHLPFEMTDTIQLIHAHLAQEPRPPHLLKPEIPLILSNLIMKLLAKKAEERYQSAFGVAADLERVLSDELGVRSEKQSLDNSSLSTQHLSFPLGERDFSGQFQIPQKLYGREQEIEILLQAFARVARGVINSSLLTLNSSFITIAGNAGVGKSALVQELHQPITAQRSYFIAGKYEQFQRSRPYLALTQAFNGLCDYLLTEPDEVLAAWRERILVAVGHNGQVLVDIIPTLSLIIGVQPPVAEIGPQEAQNRFNLTFQNFLQAVCQPEHPLVLFIDDMQWADMASLNLLKIILANPDMKHLLLIGAYRDKEVDTSHPLMLLVNELGQAVKTLRLDNLSAAHVQELIAESLLTDGATVASLSELVYEKTLGNAFFVNQFLASLYEQELLWFDFQQKSWQWDITRIRAQGLTANVVELMTGKLKQLPAVTQTMMTLAAFVGNQFGVNLVAALAEQSRVACVTNLWAAIEEGLLIPLDENYQALHNGVEVEAEARFKFLHDRVQQAAYTLTPQANRAEIHVRIGRLLLAQPKEIEISNDLFELVNQLNQGRALITAMAEQRQLAELNFGAGKKAKASAAYHAAIDYFTVSLALLGKDSWQADYRLTFDLLVERAETYYMVGQYDLAHIDFEGVLAQVQNELDQATVLAKLVTLYGSRGLLLEAVAAGKQGLALLGSPIPADSDGVKAAIGAEFGAVQGRFATMELEAIRNLPAMTDPAQAKIIELCISMFAFSFGLGDLDLYTLLTLKAVNTSLTYGNSKLSSNAYITYSVILVAGFQDYSTAYRLSKAALALGEEQQQAVMWGKNEFVFGGFVAHWKEPVRVGANYLYSAYLKSLAVGDMEFANYNIYSYTGYVSHTGENLRLVYQMMLTHQPFIDRSGNQLAMDANQPHVQLVLNLLGQTVDKLSLSTITFEADIHLQTMLEAKFFNGAARYFLGQVMIHFLYGDYEGAITVAQTAEPMMAALIGTWYFEEFYYYYALTVAQACTHWTADKRATGLTLLKAQQARFKNLHDNHCAENFAPNYQLISAEVARLEGEVGQASQAYQQAIQAAQEGQFTHKEAIAHELAARFWQELAQPDYAELHLQRAYALYNHWGAVAKVAQLSEQYPLLRRHTRSGGTTQRVTSGNTNTHTNQLLDLNTVMKSAETIMSQIDLDSLLTTLIHMMIENTGAQRGVLILHQAEKWLVQAEADSTVTTVMQAIPMEEVGGKSETPKLSGAILRYVARTQKPLVLGDASRQGEFRQTEYIQKMQPKSVLCVPLISQGTVLGLIYLENNLTTYAFTPERVELVNLLGSQAAISINNAQAIALRTEQARLRIENEMLERLNADKDKFFSIVAHDLKGPFLPLLGNLELMTEMAANLTPQDMQRMSASAHRSARRVYELLDNLLHWARLQMGRMEYAPESINLYDVAQHTVDVLSEVAEVKAIQLLNEVASALRVYADENMLDTVIRNLVNNALKFTPQGGQVTISSELGVMSDELKSGHNYVTVSIADTGVGMSEETRQKLFKLDQHVTTQGTGKETGTGLGLIICQEMVMQGGGQIWVESELRRGTTVKFTVRLDKI